MAVEPNLYRGIVKDMGRQRFDNLDPGKQSRLFDSAAAEFAERGYDGASLNRILERAGMSKSSLYYYFDDKADLFSSLVERSVQLILREIGGFDIAALSAEDFWPALEAQMQRATEFMARDAWYVRLGRMVLTLRRDKGGQAATGRIFDSAAAVTAKVLARGQELGVIRTDLPQSLMVDMAMGLGEAVDRWMLAHWDEMDEAARRALVSAMITAYRRVFAPG